MQIQQWVPIPQYVSVQLTFLEFVTVKSTSAQYMYPAYEAVFFYYCPGCLASATQMGLTTLTIWEAIKNYSQIIIITHFPPGS